MSSLDGPTVRSGQAGVVRRRARADCADRRTDGPASTPGGVGAPRPSAPGSILGVGLCLDTCHAHAGHENLGKGQIDLDTLVEVVRAAGAPVICETPGGPAEHRGDLELLRERLGGR